MAEDRVKAVESVLRDAARLHERTAGASVGAVVAVADAMLSAFGSGAKVLIFGNGGSAADAQHFACELVGRFLRERRALAAMALTADTTAMTAIANDYGFDRVFVRQIEAHGRPGDIAVGISTSGTSANVLAGLTVREVARLEDGRVHGRQRRPHRRGGRSARQCPARPHAACPGSASHADTRGVRSHRAADRQPWLRSAPKR